jgi:hypothetical protein
MLGQYTLDTFMRKVELFIASSLDGYIAKEDGNIDWLFTDSDYDYSQFYGSIDTVIMGKKLKRKRNGTDKLQGKSRDAVFLLTIFPFYKTLLYVLHVQHYIHKNKKDLASCIIIIIRYYQDRYTINIRRLWESLFFS